MGVRLEYLLEISELLDSIMTAMGAQPLQDLPSRPMTAIGASPPPQSLVERPPEVLRDRRR
jgi:hypothetical protein